MTLKELAAGDAPPGGQNLSHVEGDEAHEYTRTDPAAQARALRIANAIHMRIARLMLKRTWTAFLFEKDELLHRAKQERRLDECLLYTHSINRLRSLQHRLVFKAVAP